MLFRSAELALKGTITTDNAFLVNNIRLAHPGSKAAQENILWQNYPFYNEALGIVSFLKQPKANFFQEAIEDIDPMTGTLYEKSEKMSIKLSENIEYYFNPTLDVDLEKTKVLAAFVIDIDKISVGNGMSNNPYSLTNKLGSFNRVIDSKDTSVINYITDFYPLECFQDLKASFYEQVSSYYFNPRNFKLRLFFDIHYKANKYGKTNRQNLVYTFPLATTRINYSNLTTSTYQSLQNTTKLDIFPFIELIKDRTFTEDTEIRAWQYIGLAGNIQVSPGKTLKLIAPQIDIAPGTQLSPGVEIITGNPMGCSAPARPVSVDRMKQFCSSNVYKASNVLAIKGKKEDTIISKTSAW